MWVDDVVRIGRFLRGAWAFRVRPDDVFISSYPRSGTTWLQHITHVLQSNGDVSFAHISDVVPWYERSLSLGRLRAADLNARPGRRLFKSHLPRGYLPDGARYIYAVRDGRDVATSYFHFYCSHLGFTGDFDEFFERFIEGRLQYGSWFKHVAGWRYYEGAPDVLFVRYERLLSHLDQELFRIAQFLGLGISAGRLSELKALCEFSFMKENEEKFDHARGEPEASHVEQGRFLRRGRQGAHQELFSPEKLARFAAMSSSPNRRSTLELRLAAFLH